jgi:hypothetical protein
MKTFFLPHRKKKTTREGREVAIIAVLADAVSGDWLAELISTYGISEHLHNTENSLTWACCGSTGSHTGSHKDPHTRTRTGSSRSSRNQTSSQHIGRAQHYSTTLLEPAAVTLHRTRHQIHSGQGRIHFRLPTSGHRLPHPVPRGVGEAGADIGRCYTSSGRGRKVSVWPVLRERPDRQVDHGGGVGGGLPLPALHQRGTLLHSNVGPA